MSLRCTYLLPLRRTHCSESQMEDFAEYFHMLNAAGCEVLVVDGSPPEVFQEHERHLGELCRHLPADPRYKYLRGRGSEVHTGIDLASCDIIILGDDDISYTWHDIDRMCVLLERQEIVRPQIYFAPLPWWARISAAQMLIERGLSSATTRNSGTCGFRREAALREGHPDVGLLFDNGGTLGRDALQEGRGGYARSFFVQKVSPELQEWLAQIPERAYDDMAGGWKTGIALAMLPLGGILWLSLGPVAALYYAVAIATLMVMLAMLGRRGGAQKYFPASIPFWGPLCALELGISVYVALYRRLAGGWDRSGRNLFGSAGGRAWPGNRKTQLRAAEQSSGDIEA